LASTLRLGDVGQPIAATDAKRAVLEIGYFSGLGTLIVFLSGAVLARVSVRTARDLENALLAEEQQEAADSSGAFAAPAAPTEVLTSATPPAHRRESKGGLFHRRRADVAGD
jgi:hypothetical protein